jgi:hypothetical protein
LSDSTARTENKLRHKELEDAIVTIYKGVHLAGYALGRYLAEIQDAGVWRGQARTWKQYLHLLAERVREEAGARCSESNLERFLSHYRLFVETCGLQMEDLERIGPAVLDELRKLPNWDYYQRKLLPGAGKADPDEFLEKVREVAEEAKVHGGVHLESVKTMVRERLGKVVRHIGLIVRPSRYHQDRYYLVDVEVWRDGEKFRGQGGLPWEEVEHLSKRMGASLTLLDDDLKPFDERGTASASALAS